MKPSKNKLSELWQAYRIMRYNNRPVLKVEVVERKNNTVTFLTDYPIDRITIPEEEFYKYFHRGF